MELNSYTVIVTTIYDNNQPILTGWIEEIKSTIVQCESLPDVFTEIGTQLRILKELEDK